MKNARKVQSYKKRIKKISTDFFEELYDIQRAINSWAEEEWDKDNDELGNHFEEAADNMGEYITEIEEQIDEMLDQLTLDFEDEI